MCGYVGGVFLNLADENDHVAVAHAALKGDERIIRVVDLRQGGWSVGTAGYGVGVGSKLTMWLTSVSLLSKSNWMIGGGGEGGGGLGGGGAGGGEGGGGSGGGKGGGKGILER